MKRTRLGPRPLPLHLITQIGMTLHSCAALPLLKSGSLAWSQQVSSAAAALCAEIAGIELDSLTEAVQAESHLRASQYLTGLERYRHHPYQRQLPEPPVVWAEGTTRLLDYGGAPGGMPLLAVPSLINRAYILDLSEQRSFLRFMAVRGFRTFLIDWGAPGEVERRFDLTDYIAGRLERILSVVLELCGQPPALVGYCMGGLLALALAARRTTEVAALVLLATPWDFHAGTAIRAHHTVALRAWIEAVITLADEVSIDALQTLFFFLDPTLGERKFRGFAALDPASPLALEFVSMEDWANDGVPLAGEVARQCLFEWYGDNTPMRGLWCVGGEPVRPESITVPTLVVMPKRDRIVPPASAEVLTKAITGAQRLTVPAGHIGMMIGNCAEATLYEPLANWLTRLPSR